MQHNIFKSVYDLEGIKFLIALSADEIIRTVFAVQYFLESLKYFSSWEHEERTG